MTIDRTRLSALLAAVAALAACSGGPAAAPAPRLSSSRSALIAVPSDASFHPFLCSGPIAGDVAGDPVTGGVYRDIVGDATYPGFYRAADADNVYFRMRLNGDPRKPGSTTELLPSSWDVLVDTDGDLSTYEFMLTADGNIKSHVQWVQNTIQEPSNPKDPAELVIADFTPATDYWSVKQTADGSAFSDDADYFITLVIPKARLVESGLDLTRSFVVWGGTNAQTYSLNADFGCYVGIPSSLGDAGNDPGDLDPPDAQDDGATTLEDTPVTTPVLANDTGIEADTAVEITTPPAHGTATVEADQTVTYAPATNWFGTDTYTYRVTDGGGETDTAVVTVTVTPVDDGPPVVVDDAATVPGSTASAIDVLSNDTVIDGVASVTVLTPPAHGDATVNPDRTITYSPVAGYVGPDAFVYQVTDTDGQTGEGHVSVTVQPADSGFPVAVADTYTTPEDVVLPALEVLANDTVLDLPAVVSLVTQPAHGSVTVNADGRTLAYTPAPDYSGPDFFTYRVADRDGQTASATVSISITALDDGPPVALGDAATTPEGTAIDLDVLANDTVTDGVESLTIVVPPSHGTATVNPDRTIRYTPDASYFGPDELTYRVTDRDGQGASAPVSLSVTPVDSGFPLATPDAFTTPEDSALPSLDVLSNDVVLDPPATVSLVMPPAHGTAAVNADGTFAYAPARDYAGPDVFTYQVIDRDGQGATATVSIVVTAVDDPPVANPDSASAHAGWPPVVIPVLANDTDADGDALTVVSATQGAHGTVDVLADGTIRYLAAPDFVGVDTFSYVMSDGTTSDSTTVTVDVARALDSDGDGIPDYVEDPDHDGVVDPGETDPNDADTDGDGLPDGVEDEDHDGVVDPGETDPRNPDTDGDGLPDGVEDGNHGGTVDQGETDPRNPDTNGDGILDGLGARGGGCASGPGGAASLLLAAMAALLRRRGTRPAPR